MEKFQPPSISSASVAYRKPGPAEIAASAPPLSKAGLAGYAFGALLMLLGLLNLTEGKGPGLGPMAEAAQGMKQTSGMVYFAGGLNTCLIATLCQHTKKKD